MNRPPYETFTRPTCKGSYVLGSACGDCERCEWERAQMGTLTPDEHFARASGEARLGLIWEKLKEIQKALERISK